MTLARKATAAVAAASLLAAVAAAVVLGGTPRIALEDSPGAADRVTLYESGLAFVELTRTFESAAGEVMLAFPLPTTAIFDSLRIEGEGVAVKELRSSLAADPLLHPGDVVVVHAEDDREYRGTILSDSGNALLLAGANGTILVETSKVTAILIEGREVRESGPGTTEVAARVVASPGARSVRVSYLAYGPGWTPSYSLDLDTGDLSFHATLAGLEDWTNVSLVLVSGSPNVVARPTPGPAFERAFAVEADGGAPSAGGFAPSTPLGEMHRYELSRKVDLHRGETVRIPVLEGTVDLVRHYYFVDTGGAWVPHSSAIDLPLVERQEFRNTFSDPLPPGVLRLYRDGVWIGEDRLAAVPAGERANATVSLSREVRAETYLESQEASATKDVATHVVKVRNSKASAAPVDVRVEFLVPTYRTNVLSTQPPATETRGDRVAWDANVPAGATLEFRVTYETLRNRH